MATESVKSIKVPEDIEYRVIGNALGLLIACGGLLTGSMLRERSLEYWQEDLVPLLLVAFMAFRLMRSFMSTVLACQVAPARMAPHRQSVRPEPVAMGQLPRVPGYTEEQVLEEVAKRLEAKRAQAKKANE